MEIVPRERRIEPLLDQRFEWTQRQREVLDLIARGKTNQDVADTLGISLDGAKWHMREILSKLGVESREEAAEYWRRRNNVTSRIARVARSLLAPAFARWVGGGVLVAASVAGAVVLVSLRGQADQASVRGASDPSEAPEAVVAVPVLERDRVVPIDSVALIEWDGPTPMLRILDAETGAELTSTPTGYRPMATFRRSAGEILLYHRQNVGGENLQVLDVLDLTYGLALKHRFLTPDRQTPKVGAPSRWMALSADERYYAYSTQTMRTELPECTGPSVNGPSCARDVVRIIDLESLELVPWSFELPRYCGIGLFEPVGTQNISVSCTDGSAFVFSPAGHAGSTSGPTPRFLTAAVASRNLAQAVAPVRSSDGWVGTLLSEGSFVWKREGSPEINHRAIPDGMQLRFGIVAEVGEGRMVLGYMKDHGTQYPEGLAVFDMARGVIERKLPGYNISRSMIATGPDTLLAATLDGRLIEIDLTSGTERTVTTLATDAEWIELVR